MKSYATDPRIRELAAILPLCGIRHVVACPGSRNAPIIHTLANTEGLELHAVTDERSAGFVAIGLADGTGEAVAVCCTSGSALLNLAPAVAEAKYRHVPLLVVSGDRPAKWIDQMDGQTIRQNDCFGTLAPTFCLPENDTDIWHTNRLLNEATYALRSNGNQPVHVNIPLSEPLFCFSAQPLPSPRIVESVSSLRENELQLWQQAKRPMVVVGQMSKNKQLEKLLSDLAASGKIVVVCEHLSNLSSQHFISQADYILQHNTDTQALSPDFLVYLGGHIVSKYVKQFLRQAKPTTCWHITQCNDFIDLFQCLSHRIKMEAEEVFGILSECQKADSTSYCNLWQSLEKESVCEVNDNWNEQNAVGVAMQQMEDGGTLSLANSSTVRYAQRYALKQNVFVQCNRGVNGIEGSLSAAVGIALSGNAPTTFITGDLSFFYDVNALSISSLPQNLTIVLLNNHRGEIFSHLAGLEESEHVAKYIAAQHAMRAEGWASDCQTSYYEAKNIGELVAALSAKAERAKVIECEF